MVDNTIFTVNDSNLTMRIQQAEMYLKEFENEVMRAQGASGMFRSKEDALSRIKILSEFAPNDPRVQALFNRAKACVMGSTGNFITITDAARSTNRPLWTRTRPSTRVPSCRGRPLCGPS